MSHPVRLLSVIAIAFLVLPLAVQGSHDSRNDTRIVQPYGVPVRLHIPVVAGYEPVPVPAFCGDALNLATVSYNESFEGSHGYTFLGTSLSPSAPNLWRVTTYEGANGPVSGTHNGPNRLYFGNPSTGTYSAGHVAGVAQSPAITLPSSPSFLTFNTKWRVEWLKGYDHMWVELKDSAGNIHLLCTANAMDRGDPAGVGGSSVVQSCSPFHANPCPPLLIAGWEARSVPLPASLMGQNVQIRFTFDSADPSANNFLGWMVDDVKVGTIA